MTEEDIIKKEPTLLKKNHFMKPEPKEQHPGLFVSHRDMYFIPHLHLSKFALNSFWAEFLRKKNTSKFWMDLSAFSLQSASYSSHTHVLAVSWGNAWITDKREQGKQWSKKQTTKQNQHPPNFLMKLLCELCVWLQQSKNCLLLLHQYLIPAFKIRFPLILRVEMIWKWNSQCFAENLERVPDMAFTWKASKTGWNLSGFRTNCKIFSLCLVQLWNSSPDVCCFPKHRCNNLWGEMRTLFPHLLPSASPLRVEGWEFY